MNLMGGIQELLFGNIKKISIFLTYLFFLININNVYSKTNEKFDLILKNRGIIIKKGITIKLLDPIKKIKNIFKITNLIKSVGLATNYSFYDKKNKIYFRFSAYEDGRIAGIGLSKKKLYSSFTQLKFNNIELNNKIHTLTGITLGDNIEKVEKIYQKSNYSKVKKNLEYHYINYYYEIPDYLKDKFVGLGVFFEFFNKKVIKISIGFYTA